MIEDLFTDPVELVALSWKPVDLELSTPLVTGADRFEHRHLLVVRAEVDIDGHRQVGFGEVAPLSGWTVESIDDCNAELHRLASTLPISIENTDDLSPLNAVNFGLELAIFDAIARDREQPLRKILSPPSHQARDFISVQYTLGSMSVDDTVSKVEQAIDDGYRCLKIKVGAQSQELDIQRIKAVRNRWPGAMIRLDANGSYAADEALQFLENLSDLAIDYIEQPVAADNLEGLAKLKDAGTIDIAADESCSPFERCNRLIADNLVDVLVLKPTTVGGLSATTSLMEAAKQQHIRVVLSTLLESAIARRAICEFAASRPESGGPQGLATGSWFRRDLDTSPDHITDGRLHLTGNPGIGFRPTFGGKPLFSPGGLS